MKNKTKYSKIKFLRSISLEIYGRSFENLTAQEKKVVKKEVQRISIGQVYS